MSRHRHKLISFNQTQLENYLKLLVQVAGDLPQMHDFLSSDVIEDHVLNPELVGKHSTNHIHLSTDIAISLPEYWHRAIWLRGIRMLGVINSDTSFCKKESFYTSME